MYVNVCVRLCVFMRFPISYCAFSELILEGVGIYSERRGKGGL